jgi:uncharacterized protein YjbI with pentapeptide repeats
MKVRILFVLTMLCFQTSYAYKQQDVMRLQQTCSCPRCDLSGANLQNFILGDIKTITPSAAQQQNGFIVCNLQGANFNNANLSKAYFSPADYGPGIHPKVATIILKGATFNNANLNGAHLNAVNADFTNFSGANLQNVTILKHASFKNANFSRALMANMSVSPPMGGCGAYFNNSNFSFANLANSQINGNFTGAVFTGANLHGAKLIKCDE